MDTSVEELGALHHKMEVLESHEKNSFKKSKSFKRFMLCSFLINTSSINVKRHH